MARNILAVIVAAIWINISEFFRNGYWLNSDWTGHYRSLGLVFPAQPVNGAVWGLWGLLFAIAIYFTGRHVAAPRAPLLATTALAWLYGFVLMWIVTWNLGVLPLRILVFAVPLSILEAFVAAVIIKRLQAD